MRNAPGKTSPVENTPGNLGELRCLSTAGGGSSLTTALTHTLLIDGVSYLKIVANTFATAVVVKLGLAPYLSVFKTTDDGVTFTDYSDNAQDGSASTDITLSSLSTAANGDYLYVGAHRPFRGFTVDVDATNATASILTAQAWDGAQWTDLTITDGTDNGGATFGADGDITWTIPAAWEKTRVNSRKMYWVRFKVSAALDSTTTQNSYTALSPNSALWELVTGQVIDLQVDRGPEGWGSLSHQTDAGTAKIIINAASGPNRRFN